MNGIIREFRTDRYRVTVRALPDEDADLSFDETGEIKQAIESGELTVFRVQTQVTHNRLGVIGEDHLGSCIYRDIEAFADHKECGRENKRLAATGSKARCGSYFSDMIHIAIDEARQHMLAARNEYIRVRG